MIKKTIQFSFLFISFFCFSKEFNVAPYYSTNHDLTEIVNDAINAKNDSGNYSYDKIIFPKVNDCNQDECIWSIGRLSLINRDNLEIFLEENVVLQPIPNTNHLSFCKTKFIDVINCNNIIIRGHRNSKIRMPILNYKSGEQRHAINIEGSKNVIIKNIEIDKSGGDGIYIGKYPNYLNDENNTDYNYPSENITVENVKLNGHARNGISLVSVKGAKITNCIITNTGQFNSNHISMTCKAYSSNHSIPCNESLGLATCGPFAGIDIEPDFPDEFLQGISIENCSLIGNFAQGILITLDKLNETSNNSIDIKIKNNLISSSLDYNTVTGIDLRFLYHNNIRGEILFENNTIKNTAVNAVNIYNWVDNNLNVTFNCLKINNPSNEDFEYQKYFFLNDALEQNQKGALVFRGGGHFFNDGKNSIKYNLGGINFYGVYIVNNSSKIDLKYTFYEYKKKLANVFLNLYTDQFSINQLQSYPNDSNYPNETSLSNFNEVRNIVLGDKLITVVGKHDSTDNGSFFPKSYANYVFISKTDQVLKGIFDSLNPNNESVLNHSQMKLYPGDFNGDGITDFFCKGYMKWRGLFLSEKNDTNGKYQNSGYTEKFLTNDDVQVDGITGENKLTSERANVYIGDFNGDTKDDIFVKGYEKWKSLYISNYNNENGTNIGTFLTKFSSEESGNNSGGLDNGDYFTSENAKIYVGDYNGDSWDDLFVKGYDDWRGLYTSNKQNPNGNHFVKQFGSNSVEESGLHQDARVNSLDAKVYVGDYNGDKKDDLFIKGFDDWRSLYTSTGVSFQNQFTANGSQVGTLYTSPIDKITSPEAEVYVGDYNGDGKDDLFIKGYGKWRSLYTSAGGVAFIEQFSNDASGGASGGLSAESKVTSSNAQIYVEDYDGDGKDDLFIKGYDKYNSMYFSNGVIFGESYSFQEDYSCVYNPNSSFKTNLSLNDSFGDASYGENKLIDSKIKLFPNPTFGSFTIQSESNLKNIKILNIHGVLLHEETLSNDLKKKRLNLKDLKKGIYVVEVVSEVKTRTFKMILK